jgi:hypothetical protein
MQKDISHETMLTSLKNTKKLHPGLVEHFLVDKKLSPQRIRGVFMQAGIVSPRDDTIEELLSAITLNVVFLNVYAAKNNSFKKPKVQPKVQPKVPKKKSPSRKK